MDLNNQIGNKQDNTKGYLGLPFAQQLQGESTRQFQSSANIDQYQNTSNNNQFENQFDQNPTPLPKQKQIYQYQSKQAKISNSPIQTKIEKKSKLQKQKSKGKKKPFTNIKENQMEMINQTFPTQQSQGNNLKVGVIEKKQGSKTNESVSYPLEMEKKINEIAKEIRERVKKQPKQSQKPNNNNKAKQLQSTNRIQLRDIILSPINKPNSISFPPSNLLTFQDSPDNTGSKYLIKDIVNKQILANMWNAIEKHQKIKKYKLKLDPIKHKYPLTIFRKAILQQDKHIFLEQQKKLKEREQKLLKRRLIYNSSRYQRYIKHQKHKNDINQDRINENQKSIVLLKRQANASFLESMQNPEEKIIGIFPTEKQGQTIQVQQSNRQIQKDSDSDNQYNEDFF